MRKQAETKQKASGEPEAVPIEVPEDEAGPASQTQPQPAPAPQAAPPAQPAPPPQARQQAEPEAVEEAEEIEEAEAVEEEAEAKPQPRKKAGGPRGSPLRTKASSGSSSRAAARTSGRASSRKSDRPKAKEPRASSRTSSRTSGRHRAELPKSRNYAPFIIGAVVIALVAVGLSIGPMQKKTYLKAIAAGNRLGYDAAEGIGPGAIPDLCRIIEGGGEGGLAAAGALARIARFGGASQEVIETIQARLEAKPGSDARAAYAAALSQVGYDRGIEAAAALVGDSNASVRKHVVMGLAYGPQTSTAASALGRALGDPEDEIRELAEATLFAWAEDSPEVVLGAVDVAAAEEASSARQAAARILLAVAGSAGDERLKDLLSDESTEVRVLGVRALTRKGSADPEVHQTLAEILSSPGQPTEVKKAALEATRALRAEPAGEAALAILKARGDAGLRAKAAGAVAATSPEGGVKTLLALLADKNTPRALRLGVVDALFETKRVPDEMQFKVAEHLITLAEGEDETMAGLALLALRSVSGVRHARYSAAQWRTWIERRKYEKELVDKAFVILKKVKAEYKVHGDPDKAIQSDLFNQIGTYLQNARKAADPEDKEPLQEAISAIVQYKNSLR